MVTAKRVNVAQDALLDPESSAWSGVPQETVALEATPLVLQPSEYVQVKWATWQHGVIQEVRVRAAHNGDVLCFRLEWDDPTDDSRPNDTTNFPDQAGVMLPIGPDAPISEMGLPGQPVNMWLWRADVPTPFYVTATGRGTTTRHPASPLQGRGVWRSGVWRVTIARPFAVDLPKEQVVPLAPGAQHTCTFAVWQGSNKERAGLKAYQPLWQPLEIEP